MAFLSARTSASRLSSRPLTLSKLLLFQVLVFLGWGLRGAALRPGVRSWECWEPARPQASWLFPCIAVQGRRCSVGQTLRSFACCEGWLVEWVVASRVAQWVVSWLRGLAEGGPCLARLKVLTIGLLVGPFLRIRPQRPRSRSRAAAAGVVRQGFSRASKRKCFCRFWCTGRPQGGGAVFDKRFSLNEIYQRYDYKKNVVRSIAILTLIRPTLTLPLYLQLPLLFCPMQLPIQG